MGTLLDMSAEILHNILKYVPVIDVPSLKASCSSMNSYIAGNKLLHKDIYVENLGVPAGDLEHRCWETELGNVVALTRLLECDDVDLKRKHIGPALTTIISLMKTSTCVHNVPILEEHFKTQGNIDAFLASSSLFRHAGSLSQSPAPTRELRQLSAKAHCLYGVPIDASNLSRHGKEDPNKGRSKLNISALLPPFSKTVLHADHPVTRSHTINIPTNSYARSKVYDLRQYTDGSFWGPFKSDGSQDVDWEKMEAIMVVLGYNLRMFRDRERVSIDPIWDRPWYGAQPNSFVPQPDSYFLRTKNTAISKALVEPSPLDELDPFGISGMWMRVVCFLDYHDFFNFNFERPPIAVGEPRGPIDTREAIRLIKLKLQVTKVEPPGPNDGQDYPVVTFTGLSWSVHNSWDPNANSEIRGIVRQTPEGEIRWTTWSLFFGEERWRSEGIQVGGPRSGRGVLGNWFDKDYDIHGPAGPTAFWKLKDEIEEGDAPETPPDFQDLPFAHNDDDDDEIDDDSESD